MVATQLCYGDKNYINKKDITQSVNVKLLTQI